MSDYPRLHDLPQTIPPAQLEAHQASIWTALPGIVHQVDLSKLTCQVQPAIQAVETKPDGSRNNASLPLLLDVPLVFMHGGKYAHTFPVAQDDEVLVVFASRCIDNWWQSGGVQPQFEQRQHDLSDGIAIAGPWSQQTKLANVSTATSQWRNTDGDIYLEIDNDNQKVNLIVKGITVAIDAGNNAVSVSGSDTATVNVNQECDVTAGSLIKLTAPTVEVSGNLAVTGSIQWNTGGTATDAASHTHTGVQGGTSTSGPPVPGS